MAISKKLSIDVAKRRLGGQTPSPPPPGIWQIKLTLFKPGGRLFPSHYCQSPLRIQTAIYTSAFSIKRVAFPIFNHQMYIRGYQSDKNGLNLAFFLFQMVVQSKYIMGLILHPLHFKFLILRPLWNTSLSRWHLLVFIACNGTRSYFLVSRVELLHT